MNAYMTKRFGGATAVVDPDNDRVVAFVNRAGRLIARSAAEGTSAFARATARWPVAETLPDGTFYARLNAAL